MAEKTCRLNIYRGSPGKQYWESFDINYSAHTNVISALMSIQKRPVNTTGQVVEPVVWEDGCLEEVCGSCSMLVNGVPRQACSALIANLINDKGEISLAPLSKFILVRDLMVDRSQMFEALKKVHAWVYCDDFKDKGHGPKIPQKTQELMYKLSTCMTCGCCSESCPQVNERSAFMGPAAISQARLFNLSDTIHASDRLYALMEEGGINNCGNAQNCVRVCPKNIPLTDSIAEIYKQVNAQAWHLLFQARDED